MAVELSGESVLIVRQNRISVLALSLEEAAHRAADGPLLEFSFQPQFYGEAGEHTADAASLPLQTWRLQLTRLD